MRIGRVTGGGQLADADAVLDDAGGAVGISKELGSITLIEGAVGLFGLAESDVTVVDALDNGGAVSFACPRVTGDAGDLGAARNITVVNTFGDGETGLDPLVSGVGNDTACAFDGFYGAVVGAGGDSGGLSGITLDTACAVAGSDVAVVGAVFDRYGSGAAVADDAARGNTGFCAGGSDVALVVAAVKQGR